MKFHDCLQIIIRCYGTEATLALFHHGTCFHHLNSILVLSWQCCMGCLVSTKMMLRATVTIYSIVHLSQLIFFLFFFSFLIYWISELLFAFLFILLKFASNNLRSKGKIMFWIFIICIGHRGTMSDNAPVLISFHPLLILCFSILPVFFFFLFGIIGSSRRFEFEISRL